MRQGRPWYFLSPSYWCGWMAGTHRDSVRTSRGVRRLRPPLASAPQEGEADPDVAAEEAGMRVSVWVRVWG